MISQEPPSIPPDAQCLGCGYALCGQVAHRCPECGRPFDPLHPMTFDGKAQRDAKRLRRLAMWVPAVIWAMTTSVLFILGVSVFGMVRGDNRLELLYIWTAAVGCGWIARCAARRGLLEIEISSLPGLRRLIAVPIIITLLIGFHTWSCPHSHGFVLGPIGLAYSNCGGPCHNVGSPRHSFQLAGNWYFCSGDVY